MTSAYEDPLFLADVSVGDTAPVVTVDSLGREDFVKYAGASGDFNPIHFDEEHATDAGYPSVFGQGMLTAGILSHAATDWVGREHVETFSTQFNDQVWPDDTLETHGEIIDVDEETGVVTADLAVENQEGEAVVTGTLRARLPRDE